MRRFAKPLYGLKPVPRVRIPPSPPEFQALLTEKFGLPSTALPPTLSQQTRKDGAPLRRSSAYNKTRKGWATRQKACQTGSCNVKAVSDTGPTGTPNPLGLGAIKRDVTYQAVDPSGKPVRGAEISLHETPLPGKEGGDAKNYDYAANGSSNSQKGEEAAHRAGQFNDVMSTGGKGPAGFRQTYTVEGKPGNIIWPTKNGPVVAPSQKVLIRPDKVIILPEVNQ